jgi:hypothetical protein
MAKKFKKEEKKFVSSYPSMFGSHKSMVVSEKGDHVVLKDVLGEYVTLVNRLDNGMADPNRYSNRVPK